MTITFTNEGKQQQMLISFGAYSIAYRFKKIIVIDERVKK